MRHVHPPVRRPAERAHRWVGPLLKSAGFAAFAAAGTYGVLQSRDWLTAGDTLPLRSVAVQGVSAERIPEIIAYAEVREGMPLFGIDLEAVRARVGSHPFVADARVRRVPPDTLEIHVTSRAPLALAAVEGRLYLLDDTGVPFKIAQPGDGLDLPVITGVPQHEWQTPQSPLVSLGLVVIKSHQAAGAPGGALAEVNIDAAGRPTAILQHGERVVLGRGDLTETMERLGRVWQALERQERAVSEIRLDDSHRPERVAVRLRVQPEVVGQPGG
ncbi:MAG: cell division protein FtsQ/DivIB [Myxococcota bacterium]